MAMQIAEHVALCTRLSRFVQLQPPLSRADAAQLCEACSALVAFYDAGDASSADVQRQSPDSLLGGVSSAAIDDVVLLALHKLLVGAAAGSESRVQELLVAVLVRVLARSERQIATFSESKLLGFVQSCVLLLPPPGAATDGADATEQQRQAGRALQSQAEELRLDVLASLQLLLSRRAPTLHLSTSSVTTERTHFFAYLVSSLLHIAQHDKCRPAARRAVDALMLVVDFVHDATLLRQFFPGVSVGMWKAINAPKQSSKVVVAALQCLSKCITLCVSDARNTPAGASPSSFSIEGLRTLMQQQQQRSGRDEDATSERSDAVKDAAGNDSADKWLEETAVNVDIILSKLFGSQINHKSWRVRDAMVGLCGAVVLASRSTLRESFFRCYEELLVLRVDPIAEVAASAQRVVRSLQDELSMDEWLQMVPVLAERFQMHLSTLSLKCATDHESVSVRLMRKLIGYVSFLGSRLGSHLDAAMDTIYAALCRVLEFDAIDIDLVLHHKLSEDTGEALTTAHFQKRLRYFHEEESVNTAAQLLSAIGSVSTPALFIDCAFSTLTSEEVAGDRHAEVFVVLNGFLRAYVKERRNPLETTDDDIESLALAAEEGRDSRSELHRRDAGVDVHLVGRILEDLFVLDVWSEQAAGRSWSHTSRAKSRKTLKAEVSQRALMVECIGICVEILHRDFDVFLLHTLYPLVEKLGSQDVEVEHAALGTLRKIYFFCGYASVEALFEANMDYFVDALCSRLEHLEEFPLTALVVEGLLRHTKIASLPLVDEVANSLLRSVDLYQDSPYISRLLRALKLLLSSMAAEEGSSSADIIRRNGEEASSRSSVLLESPGDLLKQFIKEIRILSGESTAEDEADTKEPARVEELASDEEEEDMSDEVKMKGAMPVEFGERNAIDSSEDDSHPNGESSSASSSPYTALIVEILDRAGHFLSESDPIACCLVLSIIEEGVVLLQQSRTELLPLIHRIWSTILHRLAVTNKPIVIATIRLVTTLAIVAGDFIGDRFVENVWPALRTHLRAMEAKESSATSRLTRSMLLLSTDSSSRDDNDARDSGAESENAQTPRALEPEARTRRTHATQLLLASLECLSTVSSKSSAVSVIVPEAAAICRQFLSAEFPAEVVGAAKTLFEALAGLNGDEVFCALAPLAVWTPPAPPSSRFPAFTPEATSLFYKAQQHSSSGGFSRDTALHSRDTAALLLRQLQRNH